MADEIDPNLFTALTMPYVSVLWVYLDLSNDLPLSDLLLMDLYIFLLYDCGFDVLLTLSMLFFAMVGRMSSFITLDFVLMSIIPSLKFLSLVVTNKCF